VATKATEIVHVPGDPRGWAPFEFLFRTRQQFLDAFDTQHQGGLVFCPTRRRLPVGFPVSVMVRLGRRRPPLQLQGVVVWRRSGKHSQKIRAGVGVEFSEAEHAKLGYVMAATDAGDEMKSRRRHERIPLRLSVAWKPEGAAETFQGTLRDIGRGGAFVSTGEEINSETSVVLEVAAPGAAVPMPFVGRVAWTGQAGDETGFGLEWRARDAGGSRRIRELVRRLTENTGNA